MVKRPAPAASAPDGVCGVTVSSLAGRKNSGAPQQTTKIAAPAKIRELETLLRRLLKFHMVGVIGIGVQLCFLFVFRTVLHLNYLLATALAVECAVLHNFLWHEHFTWSDRSGGSSGSLRRLLRFNLSTGLISIVGNLVLMRLLVGSLHLQYMLANILSIGACSLLNFWASDQMVFQADCARGIGFRRNEKRDGWGARSIAV